MGVIAADYDNDGNTDIFVANDVMPQLPLPRRRARAVRRGRTRRRRGLRQLRRRSRKHGRRLRRLRQRRPARFLRDLLTSGKWPTLYHNLGGGLFEDVTVRAGAALGSYTYVKWGCGFVDFDNDGYRDLFVVCGHIATTWNCSTTRTSYAACPVLLRNIGHGTFVNVSDSGGDGLRVKAVGRGVAFDDLDNDGRIDVVILNSRAPPTILRNESVNANHWIQVRLRGVKTNRDGVGARVKVVAGDLTQIDEVHSGRGYQSHYGTRLHFGLGKRERVDRIEVHWIGGGVDVLEDVRVDQCLTITEAAARHVRDVSSANLSDRPSAVKDPP